jgi:hypothetical protein
MTRSVQPGWLDLIRFLAICGLFSLSVASSARAPFKFTGASNCTSTDLDAYFQFINGPEDYYTVAVNQRNVSNHACVFDGVYGASFAPDHVADNPPFTLCYRCKDRLPNGTYPVTPPLILNPGQVALQTFRWKTTSTDKAVSCVQPNWMSGSVLLAAPSLLKKICSNIDVSLFSLAAPADSSLILGQPRDGGQTSTLQLTSGKSKYYDGENFSLHVSVIQGSSGMSLKRESQPTFYLQQRSPDGETRIDEVQPRTYAGFYKNWANTVLGHQPGNWESGFELDSGARRRWNGLGEHAMQLSWLLGSADEPELHFGSSNVLRIQIADPSAITRKWGARTKGIAADITLDKDTYRLGEDVPLHLAIANFDAEVPVYGSNPIWEPCNVVSIEVEDADGHSLLANERFPGWRVCVGNAVGLMLYAKGRVVPLEQTLGGEGWLPNHPGTYAVVVSWNPLVGLSNDASSVGRPAEWKSYGELKPFAAAHATSIINIVSSDISHSK